MRAQARTEPKPPVILKPMSTTVPELMYITRLLLDDDPWALSTTVPGTTASMVTLRLMHNAEAPYVEQLGRENVYVPAASRIRLTAGFASLLVSSATELALVCRRLLCERAMEYGEGTLATAGPAKLRVVPSASTAGPWTVGSASGGGHAGGGAIGGADV